jgi:hypothetical protein
VADVQLLESEPLRRGLALQRQVLQGRRLLGQAQARCAELQARAGAAELRLQQALQRQQVGAPRAPAHPHTRTPAHLGAVRSPGGDGLP